MFVLCSQALSEGVTTTAAIIDSPEALCGQLVEKLHAFSMGMMLGLTRIRPQGMGDQL